ncbi:hypothetical protein TNCV_3332221 [Trichonephila clavipes]|nr:hypothetical protein TNCV_3332221 [Trichonephila clavipes]
MISKIFLSGQDVKQLLSFTWLPDMTLPLETSSSNIHIVKTPFYLHALRSTEDRGGQKPPTNLTRGLAARRLFRVPPCREGTIHLQTSPSSLGFEPSPYGTAVSVANHYTGRATFGMCI